MLFFIKTFIMFRNFQGCSRVNELEKLIKLRNILASKFVGRDMQIDAILVTLISRESCILVSPPGTAKTLMIETMASLINAKYFYYLLTPFTEPDELLGPIDIASLKSGKLKRITTNRLPDADIVFLDEIFKASSAIRNTLLDIILYRRILNGIEYVPIKLIALYTASNEVSTDKEDLAFYDRLTVRSFFGYVEETLLNELIDAGIRIEIGRDDSIEPIMSKEDILKLNELVNNRFSSLTDRDDIKRLFIGALSYLQRKGIQISDRRKIKILKIATAYSVLYNDNDVLPEHLSMAFLTVAPQNADDIEKIKEMLLKLKLSRISDYLSRIEVLIAESENLLQFYKRKKDETSTINFIEIFETFLGKVKQEVSMMPAHPLLKPQFIKLEQNLTKLLDILENIRGSSSNGEN